MVSRRTQVVLGLTVLLASAFAATSAGKGLPSSPPGLDKAIAAKEKHAQKLLDKPGVAGIGVALNKGGRPVIEIFKEKDDVPDLPADLDGVPVESVTTGIIQPRSAPTDRFPRPVPIGVSGGLAGVATGTLGVRVTDGTNVYVLSNNHVLAGINTASIGDPIIQPGDADGGSDPGDRIATLAAYQTIDFNGGINTMDAAIARSSTTNLGTSTPADGYGTPSAVTTPAFIGQAVQKYGRTTGSQLGNVTATDVSVDVCYLPIGDFCLEQARFGGQFSISPGPFSAPGDSGSLIVTQGDNQPVGLLFAGGDGLTIANPIEPVLQRFGVSIDGAPPTEGPPSVPSGLSAFPGEASVSLSWTASAFDGGSPVTNYKVYRGTSAGAETFLADAGTSTTFVDSGLTNGTSYYYKLSAENAYGESPLSNEVSATPTSLVPPDLPLPIVDNFDRLNENPLSDGLRWTNGVIGSGESGLYIPSNWLACSKSTTCTAWRNSAQYGPDSESWARIATLPGTANSVRLYVRIQQPGSAAADGYMLRTIQQTGTDQVLLERVDNGTIVTRLTILRELAVGDTLLLRAKATTIEAWRNDGSSWTRIGLITDSTYGAAGYAGIGLRGTTGRLEDFGARNLGVSLNPPGAPAGLSAAAGVSSTTLTWTAPSFDGGSPITGYRIYRGTSAGGETFLQSVGNVTSFVDSGLTNGTTYYYKVSAENSNGEGALSNEAAATPADLVPPAMPMLIVDNFDRLNENPLSDGGRWSNGVISSGETGLYIPNNWLACSRSTTCSAWRNTAQYGPDSESWARIATLPGTSNSVRLYVRIQQPGSAAADGYMLRTIQQTGTDQVLLERVDNGTIVTRLTILRELAVGDTLLLRAKATTIEAWRNDGSSWTRIGLITDSTYGAAGYAGIGLRGTTGRLEDFGARGLGGAAATAPSAPQSLQATAGNAQVSLAWAAPSSDGGSAITGYRVYRGTAPNPTVALTPDLGVVTSFLDTGRTNGQIYYYKVTALNAIGESVASNEANATPSVPAGAPSAPQSLQATAGNAQVSLAWAAPSSDGGSAITGYRVYRGTAPNPTVALTPDLGVVTSFLDTGRTNGQIYYYKVTALNAIGESVASNEANATPSVPAGAPSAPQSLQATAGNAQVSLAWAAPSSDGGSAITGYRVYRGTAPNPTVALTPDLGVVTSFLDTGRTNGQIYYYKVTALNAIGESVASNAANATPTDLVLPVEPLSILDTFNRANENPLSFASRWGNGILGSSERSLQVVSNQCASDRNTTATAWWKTQLGPDSESYATISTLPGNGDAVRLYVRLQTPGSAAVDGYMLLFTQASGTDQLTLYRVTNGALTQLSVVNQEIAAGNQLLLRAKGTGLEAWVRAGTTWTRASRVTDATYTGAGYAGIGIRGKTGRLDDFGAR